MSTISVERPRGPRSDVPDGELVRQHLQGRDGAFEVLYRRYNDRLVGWFVRRVNDHALAEDLAQDTMVRVLKYADSFDQDRPMWPWLKTAAYRVMVNHLEQRPDGDESFEDQYEDEGELDPRMMSVDERPALERVMGSLPERHQVALSLRYVRGWASDDVADFLGLTANACHQLMFRARKAARREYERMCGEVHALLWPLLVPLGARWRSALDRFRAERWTQNSPQLASMLPSIENAVQVAVATAVTMFVMATAIGVGQMDGPDEAAAGTVGGAFPADFAWDSSSRSETPVGGPMRDDATAPDIPAPGVPEHNGGTRRIVAVSSGDTTPEEAGSDAELSLVTETERSVDEDEDRATIDSRIHSRIGEDEDESWAVVEVYCDAAASTQLACDAIDELP